MTSTGLPPPLTQAQIEQWLSEPRFRRYLGIAGGDVKRGFALYDWNSHLAAAALIDVGHLEIALRNAYDTRLVEQHPQWAVDRSSTLFTRASGMPRAVVEQQELNQVSTSKIDVARDGLGVSASHGQVVAALDFGFWASLTARERTATFWTPILAPIFPTGVTRGQVHALVDNVRKFRNRLAHGEPMFSKRTGLDERMRDLRQLFTWVSPEAATWVQQRSRVAPTIARCPVPNLVTSQAAQG